MLLAESQCLCHQAYSTLVLEAGCGLIWALHSPRGLLPRGVSRSGGYDRFYSFHRSSKNKQGTAGVGYSERWRRSISVRETSEYSLGLLLLLLWGCLAAEKVSSHHLLTPACSSHALATAVEDSSCLSVFKDSGEKRRSSGLCFCSG